MDGFTEGKIQKFGAQFLEVVNDQNPVFTEKQSLHNILLKNPIETKQLHISNSTLNCLFKNDTFNINEIANTQ